MKDCVNPTADKVKEEMLNKKRPSLDNDVKTERPVYARLPPMADEDADMDEVADEPVVEVEEAAVAGSAPTIHI